MMHNTKHRLAPRYIMTRVGGEAVVAPVCDSTADMGQIMSLNATGADILEAIQKGLSQQEVVNQMVASNPNTDKDVISESVAKFISQMIDMGLIELSPDDDDV